MAETSPVISLTKGSKSLKDLESVNLLFKKKFGRSPSFFCRVPGRVNLIGEHIDYCGYAVFPMAIEQDILVAVGKNLSNTLNLTNFNQILYQDFTTTTDVLKIDQQNPKWYHYFLCGVRGILETYKIELNGLDVTIRGTIPPSAGLSSSSALVCAAALATAHAHGIAITKMDIANLCAKSERYIGTQGGGMDQAIAFLAESGSAKLIEFNPLKATDVQLPNDAAFVIANSCVEINKASTSHYNERVVECRLATQLIAKARNLKWQNFSKLGDVQKALGIPLSQMETIVKEVLHPNAYNRKEICELLGLDIKEFINTYLSSNTSHMEQFQLYKRALHVYQEASRVFQFKEICEEKSDESIIELGNLMNNSHISCRDLYECSHPDLDDLVEISINAGAVGSRLTGAGWGGCSVSLVPSVKLATFLENIKQYYMKYPRKQGLYETSVFQTQPGGGAVVYKVDMETLNM